MKKNQIKKNLLNGFRSEKEFKQFIKHNKNYILNILDDNTRKQKHIIESHLFVYLTRFALGRDQYICEEIVDLILNNWIDLNKDIKDQLVKEIIHFEKYVAIHNNTYDQTREIWAKILNKQLFGLLAEFH